MITLTWYNIVAIMVGILLAFCFESCSHDKGMLAGLRPMLVIFVAIAFYTFWGGIFWW